MELARGVGHNTYGEPAWPNDLLYMFPICIWANTLFGHNLATWTTHETAQRQEVASCTHWFIRQLVSLAHSSISASKDAHPEGLDLWALLLFVLSEKRRGCRTRLPRMKACPRWLCVYGSVSLWTALSLVEVYDEGAFAVE